MDQVIGISCVKPGGGARLVDQGRPGRRAEGLPTSGPADRRAANRAREILQLPAESVLLETALSGGQWLLSGRGQIALTGADMQWKLNGRPAEAYTTIDLDGDFLLDGSIASRGCRSYLAVRGDWQVPKLMGSVSPGLPGIKTIAAGWSAEIVTWEEIDYSTDLDPYQHCPDIPMVVKVIPGPEWDWLSPNEQHALIGASYRIGQESNRQGLRLEDTAADKSSATLQSQSILISSPVLPGTVQLSPAGPILLLHDAQTLGGFPRILLLAEDHSIDAAGQLKVGDEVRLSL